MGKTSQHFHIELDGLSRESVESAAKLILKQTKFIVSRESEGWVCVAAEQATETGWPSDLANALNVRVVCFWETKTTNSWGEDVFEPRRSEDGSQDWNTVFGFEELKPTVEGTSLLPKNYRYRQFRFLNGLGPKDCLHLAKTGDIDPILGFAFEHPGSAYFWLLIASDFGHDVDDQIGDLFEHTDLDDDDGGVAASVLFDVIAAYVVGDIVSKNISLACGHLQDLTEMSFDYFEDLDALGEENPQFKAGLVRQFGERPFWEIRQRLRRLERLHTLNAPFVILDNEIKNLSDALEGLRTPFQAN